MKKLRIWLLFSLYIIFNFFVFLYVYYVINNKIYHTNYKGNESEIVGYINDFKIDGNKLTIFLKAKEMILVNHYFISIDEYNEIINNINIGDVIKVKGILKIPNKNKVFNLFNYQNYLLSKKIYWLMDSEELIKLKDNQKIRYKIKNIILKRINNIKESSPYVKAFIIGDTYDIENDILSSYQQNGVNHLLAISGSHFTILSGIILYLLNKISKNKKINYLITILLLLFYLFLIDFQPAAMRACFLFILLTINKFFNFKIKTIYYLILLFNLLLLYNPFYLYHLGFLFSFVISFYLIIFQSIIKRYNNYLIKTFIISLIAFLVSIPILINTSFQINFLSPIINIIFVPFINIIIFPLSIIVFIFPCFDKILMFFLLILEKISLFFSSINAFTIILRSVSLLTVILYYLLLSWVLYLLSKKKYYGFIILFIILIIHNNWKYLEKYSKITVIDVGQGDSILIELPYNQGNILIDTGGIISYDNEQFKRKNKYSIAKQLIIPYLKSISIKKLDYLIITHGDYDHMGEAINIVNNFKIENVIFNCGPYNDLEKELIKVLNKKKIQYYSCINELNIKNYKFQFLITKEYDNENDNSNVIYFNYNNYKFLFMGDAGINKEKDILEKYNLIDIDFLKVGHHGSNTSSSEKFINSINPKYSLISVGENNKFGHPKKSVLDILNKSKIYRTDEDGSIKIELNKNGYKVETCYP
ncbi:MAG: DNA internalization-related competence protein ComEC/Rec2 [Mollicutes bacterium]|nr:DNA internalization-related competence protein ComEC/Rec2 [Mollicutes bacterium]